MAGRAAGRIHGDDLIGEVLRNMEEGLFRIRRKTVVPSIYRIYLNPDDYEPFRDVVPFIAGEIRAALDDRLVRWNASKRRLAQGLLKKIGAGEAVETIEFMRVADAWTVEIYPDLDGELAPGEIEVYSELGAPEKTEHGAGSLTRRIFPKGQEPPLASPPPPQQIEPAGAARTVATSRPPEPSLEPEIPVSLEPEVPVSLEPEVPVSKGTDLENDGTKGRAFAYIRYVDHEGPRTFEVTKSQMVIGRGGRSYWVDLRLETLPDVSREHCRIRRDPETGRFTIEDVSQFGTAVNGKPVGQNAAAELPRRATISLAGVIDLQWEAA